ncbi:unnamed protein product [Sphagnum troendelagicum]|uniref:Sulfite exporter TauE/SafE family protein n=1 Tax=Sphagnum troendelagicum TaxID=128251 RepID=A0ABP0UFT3_9BRYO
MVVILPVVASPRGGGGGGAASCCCRCYTFALLLVILLYASSFAVVVSGTSVEEFTRTSSPAYEELPSAGGGVDAKFEELRGLGGDGGLSAAAVLADGFISSAVDHHRHHAELDVPQNNMVSYTHDVNNGGDEAVGDGSVKTKLLQVIGSIAARFTRRHDLDPDPDYRKKWPKFEPSWRLAIGTFLGFTGAAFGSVGGVGGGGFYLPILSLVIGFDTKTTTALSKSMIMGAAFAAVLYNLRMSHPTCRNQPVIDYNIALLFQPMLLLGISIGVTFNIMFADWMVTLLLILLFTSIVISALRKAICLWDAETQFAKVSLSRMKSSNQLRSLEKSSIFQESYFFTYSRFGSCPTLQNNVQWKSMGLLFLVWLVFLILQILKNGVATCSVWYWVVNCAQIPVALGVTGFQALCLYRTSQIASQTNSEVDLDYTLTDLNWGVGKLVIYAGSAVGTGTMGGLLGVGGGTIIGPFLLELGLPPEVSSATATFVMLFSASMSVVEYSLLGRLPRDQAIFLTTIAVIGAFWGQSMVHQVIHTSGKTSIIIFVLAICIAFSAVVLGLQGLIKVYGEWQTGAYMGFENLCST